MLRTLFIFVEIAQFFCKSPILFSLASYILMKSLVPITPPVFLLVYLVFLFTPFKNHEKLYPFPLPNSMLFHDAAHARHSRDNSWHGLCESSRGKFFSPTRCPGAGRQSRHLPFGTRGINKAGRRNLLPTLSLSHKLTKGYAASQQLIQRSNTIKQTQCFNQHFLNNLM